MTTEYLTLPVELTPDEVRAKGVELAARVDEMYAIDVERKEAAAAIRERRADVEAQVIELKGEVRSGREYREVECRLEPDFQAGVMQIVRVDTGEFVRSRPLSPDERQPALFAIDGAGAGKSGAGA